MRTQRRELILGDSLSAFMRSVGVYNSGGAVRSRLQEQMRRLFNSYVQLVYEHEHGEVSVNSLVADRTEFWWNPKRPDDRTLWESKIELGEKFFEEVIRHPVPLDLNILKTMKRSSLGLDRVDLHDFWHARHLSNLPRPYTNLIREVVSQIIGTGGSALSAA